MLDTQTSCIIQVMNNSDAQHKALKAKMGKTPNQDYRGRVARHLAAGGDPKYVNVKKKAKARRDADLESRSKKAGFYVHGHKNLGDVYEA